MLFRAQANPDRRSFAAFTALVVTLLLSQLAGPLVHHACSDDLSGHHASVPGGVASLHELDGSALEKSHGATDCVVCLSLTKTRSEYLVEPIQRAAPAVAIGTAEFPTSRQAPSPAHSTALPARGPPTSA